MMVNMAKAEATVEELVGMIERGELRLPEMQRKYVWRSTRVRDLLDSLYRGYPSGAILLWETDEPVPLQDMAIEQQANRYQSTRLLLDGQQRLTSLSAVIRGDPVVVRGRKRPIEILFNLDHPDEIEYLGETDDDEVDDEDISELDENDRDGVDDELQQLFNKMTFVVATKKLAQMPQWVKVSEVFASESDKLFLKRAGITDFEDPLYEKYSQRLAQLRGIKKYVYRMDVLERNLNYDEVTEIFVRVNSLGAKLKSSDLALAQITAKWRGSLDVFNEFKLKCDKSGFDMDLGLHLKNMVAIATNQSRFRTTSSIPLKAIKESWVEACSGMEFAINFIRNNAGIESPVLLSSQFLLVLVSYLAKKRDFVFSRQEERILRQWVLLSNAKGHFSMGSSESILDQDIAMIRDGADVSLLFDRLRQQVGRFEIEAEELEGRNQRSALFKTMFLAFRDAGAKDWDTQIQIAIDHSGNQHRLQFHHIFPKNLLKGKYSRKEIDDIANLCFISGRTNRRISDKDPIEYFPRILEKSGYESFNYQCIPTDPELLSVGAYREFLKRRRELIADRLNHFLGVGSVKIEG